LARELLKTDGEFYGFTVMRTSGVISGTAYPILNRMVDAGWLTDRWENISPKDVGRPRRHLYRLSAAGRRELERMLAKRPLDNSEFTATFRYELGFEVSVAGDAASIGDAQVALGKLARTQLPRLPKGLEWSCVQTDVHRRAAAIEGTP
jgi:hypothetical protein